MASTWPSCAISSRTHLDTRTPRRRSRSSTWRPAPPASSPCLPSRSPSPSSTWIRAGPPDGTQIVFTVMRYPMPPTDENILGSSIAVVKADGSEADAPRILTDPAMFANLSGLEPRRRAHRLQYLPARLLPGNDEGDEPVHDPARRDRADPGHALRRERHAGDPADLDARRQADHLHADRAKPEQLLG